MLIKTPSYQEISDFFYVNFKLIYKSNARFEDLFVQKTTRYAKQIEDIYAQEPIFLKWKNYTFPIFIHDNTKQIINDDGKISFDIALNSFIFLSGWLELFSPERDKHGRFPFAASLQKKHQFVDIPVVSIYFEILFEHALQNGISISKKSIAEDLIFTHDIDQLRSGWYENFIYYKENFSLRSLFEIPKNIFVKLFSLKDDYYIGMEDMLKIDLENKIKTISFFIPEKSSLDADFYLNDKRFKTVLNHCKETQEIGFHSGYDTFKNQEKFNKQKVKLETFFEQKITKSRQHFLRYEMSETPYIIEESEILEDYTLGFAEQYGFRNGTSHPFYLFNFKENKAFNFLSIPLVFMDVSLTNYTAISIEEMQAKFNEIIKFILETKTTFPSKFSILFHNSVFSKAKYRGFTDFYKKLILL